MSLQHTKAGYSLDLKYTIRSEQQDATSAICNYPQTKKGPTGPFSFNFEKAHSCLSAFTGLPVAVFNDW
jgi:predicted methyltransferase